MSLSFALAPEQEEFRAVVGDFADEVIAPVADDINAQGRFPTDIVRRMAEVGLFGIPFDERYDGMGGDFLTLCLAIEEIGRVDQSLGITLEAAVGLGAAPLDGFGTDEQKERWLPELCRGERIGAFGLSEPGGGSDNLGGTTTRAARDGDDWVINGSKVFITNAGTELTSIITVTAWTGDDEMTAIIVPAGAPGLTVAPPYRKVGWHASDTRELAFSDLRVPVANTLGEVGAGFRQFLQILDDGRIAIAALATGLIQGCIDECVRYASERTAFGRPIGEHQAIAFKIADFEVAAQASRHLYYNAAWRREQGLPYKKEASIAKLYSSEQAVTAAREATQIFGGYGFMTESRVGRFYQDAKVLEIGEGTSEIQRILIARELGL
ncbi:MAG TPA: acyl-CoA dehydrogenase family protein [Euzebyales bacterium]|nr:acyl-CoA dehydrogenase family protein [Euzebyales bacterium]